jgi:mxaJ protein
MRLTSLLGVVAVGVLLASAAFGVNRITGPGLEAPDQRFALDSRLPAPDSRALRICADPNNLPFSNAREEGFENRLAELLAREMGRRVAYTWWAQRRGYVRNTLDAGACDVLLGVPATFDRALRTRPYYRSSYVFVTRADDALGIRSLDDPALRRLRVGVQLIGDDYTNTPPAHALARRGIVENVRGYSVVGDYAEPNPPARIIDALAEGEIDVAIAWGPLAGYFAERERSALAIAPVSPASDAGLPMTFDISVGVRRGETALRDTLDAILERRREEIDRILAEYRVPRVAEP